MYNKVMKNQDLETIPISREEFQTLEIFSNVSFESIAGYLLGCKTFVADPGTILIDPDHAERRLIILLEGLMEVQLEEHGGVFKDTIEAGHCAGEMSVFDNVKPSAKVIAKEQSRLLIIPPDIALAMLNASHALCLNFLHLLSQRIRNNNRVVCKEELHIREIEENSKIDALTGLHNRRWLEDVYTREIHRCNAGNYALTAIMLDIDHFKHVNDTYGHLVGDLVLKTVAQTIIDSLRPTDLPVRYGGEEFTIFLPETSTENARVIAERLRSNMEKTKIALPSGQLINVTISIGLAERIPEDTVRSIIDRADQALYNAKENGRNRVCLNLGENSMFLF